MHARIGGDPEILRPHQVAWLRRSDLFVPGFDVWEKPDGELIKVMKGVELRLMRRGRDVVRI